MRACVVLLMIGGITWSNLWFTPDQQGQRLLERGEFQAAAEAFRDPMRQGVAWFRAGEFEKSERTFARVATPDAEFNRGNCLVMQGKYEAAIERYDRALQLRPKMKDAQVNREIAVIRAERIESKVAIWAISGWALMKLRSTRRTKPKDRKLRLLASNHSRMPKCKPCGCVAYRPNLHSS